MVGNLVAIIVVAVVVSLILILWLFYKTADRQAKRTDPVAPKYQNIIKPHMKIEGYSIAIPPISTATFYHGLSIPFIYDRTKLIMEANPWLASRIISSDDGYELHYNTNNNYRDYISEHLSDLDISINPVQFLQFNRIKVGVECQDRDLPLFDVNIVRLADKIALVISMSHTLGDADTYYKIYRMYDSANPILKMNLKRVEGVPEQVDKVFGDAKKSPEAWISYRFWWRELHPLNHQVKILQVSSEEINRQKQNQQCKAGEKFISTNDVLTSWIFKAAHTCFGILMFSLRGKLEIDIPEDAAGNYYTSMNYTCGDYMYPGQIRRSVSKRNGMYLKDAHTPFPSIWRVLLPKSILTDITSWVSFYHCLVIGGNAPIYHCPLSVSRSPDARVIIFKPNKDDIYLHAIGLSDKEIQATPLVKELY
ncbi:hypothetical protein HDV01_003277 [Terramyces sp. JEL0728]|nr:hypothetical protein HDV01_003277 [Terramyces sp. JEL0728]